MRRATILALIEAKSVTGIARNVIEFAEQVRMSRTGFDVPGKRREWESEPEFELDFRVADFVRGESNPNRGAIRTPFLRAAEAAGIGVDRISERFRLDPILPVRLRQLVARVNPAIVETHSVKSHFVVWLSGVWRDRPWIAFHHGYTTTSHRMRVYNQCDHLSLRHAHRVVTVARSFIPELAHRGVRSDRLTVINNAVTAERYTHVTQQGLADIRRAIAGTLGERLVVCIARLSGEKSQVDLIRALARIRRSSSTLDVRLVFAGVGPDEQSLRRAAQQLEVLDSCSFIGHVRDVAPLYAVADVVALPSRREGFPNALLEAMAAGVPVVATAVGDVAELIRHGETGLLVPPRSPDALSESIVELLTNAPLRRRLTTAARARVRQSYRPVDRAVALRPIYEALITLTGVSSETSLRSRNGPASEAICSKSMATAYPFLGFEPNRRVAK